MKRNNLHTAQAEIVTGYELDEARGWFSIILPEASTNLCINPSLETNTTGWSAMAGAISRVSTYQRRGTYSLRCAPTAAVNDGCYFGATATTLIPTTLSNWYTLSLDFRGAGGYPYQLYFADQWGTKLNYATLTFYATGDWQRVSVPYYETQTTSRRFYITKNGSSNIYPFYVDGAQVENKAYATTYFDGDSVGYVTGVSDFYWTGARHASTSARSAQTGAGGKVMKLKDLGFTLMAVVGLGMAPMQPISQDYGWQDGALYQRTRKPARDFTLVGQMEGQSLAELHQNRAALMQYLSPDRTATHQPLLLQYEYANELGEPTGEVLNIPAVYRGGLEGQTDNLYAEKTALSFTEYFPLIQKASEEGASLGYQATLANANYIVQRSGDVWAALGSGANNAVYAVEISPDGYLYAAGAFSTMGGVVCNGIARWDGTIWTSLGTGAAGASPYVLDIAFGPDGTLYAAGYFSTMGGVANTQYIARWNGTVWSAMGTGGTGATGARSIVIGKDGTVYVGGFFTGMSGVANTRSIAKWNGAAWSAMGTGGAGGSGAYSLAIGPDDAVYAGGDFTSMGGVADTLRIAKWNGTAWTALSTGADDLIISLVVGTDGILYAGGDALNFGAVACNRIAKWNGTTWFPLSTGVNGSVYVLRIGPGGFLYVAGSFTLAGGVSTDRFAVWNGSAFILLNGILPGSTIIRDIAFNKSEVLFFGFSNAGNATVSVATSISPTNTDITYPIITLTGPGTVYQIRNVTTGDTISFNLTLLAGEVATLNLASGNISFTSNFRGNILSTILPGSNLASFKLMPGANTISVFVAGTTSAATAVDFRWTPQYLGLER